MIIRPEFTVHILNEEGIAKAEKLAMIFTSFLNTLEDVIGNDGRAVAIVRTKLEETAFFAKKAMAQRVENQKQ